MGVTNSSEIVAPRKTAKGKKCMRFFSLFLVFVFILYFFFVFVVECLFWVVYSSGIVGFAQPAGCAGEIEIDAATIRGN